MSEVRSSDVADDLLVRQAASGSLSAFEALYRQNIGRVFAVCLRMTGSRSLAEDLAQDAFVRAWERLASFDGRSAFSTWLHRVTVNVVLGHKRWADRRGGTKTTLAPEAHHAVGRTEPADAVDLERAILGLPERARLVFVLHDVEGYRHTEIAEIVGIAEGTSKAQLHRARRLLREVLS
jgi:RNA polymerase sigma-70 factor (ECF subfamily)